MKSEIEAYLRGVLPLLDEEKVSQLLSKGAHVVDIVCEIARTDTRLNGIIESIYQARTCQTLVNKIDGNRLLEKYGLTNLADFYFNPEASDENLADLATDDTITKYSSPPYWHKVIENLCWDIPAEYAYPLFSGYVYSVLEGQEIPENTEKLERAYNYLLFSAKRHGVWIKDLADVQAKVVDKLPNVATVDVGVMPKQTEQLQERLDKLKEKSQSQGFVGGYTGMGWSGVIMTTGMMRLSSCSGQTAHWFSRT